MIFTIIIQINLYIFYFLFKIFLLKIWINYFLFYGLGQLAAYLLGLLIHSADAASVIMSVISPFMNMTYGFISFQYLMFKDNDID
jgi:hypothetical protein